MLIILLLWLVVLLRTGMPWLCRDVFPRRPDQSSTAAERWWHGNRRADQIWPRAQGNDNKRLLLPLQTYVMIDLNKCIATCAESIVAVQQLPLPVDGYVFPGDIHNINNSGNPSPGGKHFVSCLKIWEKNGQKENLSNEFGDGFLSLFLRFFFVFRWTTDATDWVE